MNFVQSQFDLNSRFRVKNSLDSSLKIITKLKVKHKTIDHGSFKTSNNDGSSLK